MEKLKEQLTKNIWTALDDYFRHTSLTDVMIIFQKNSSLVLLAIQSKAKVTCANSFAIRKAGTKTFKPLSLTGLKRTTLIIFSFTILLIQFCVQQNGMLTTTNSH